MGSMHGLNFVISKDVKLNWPQIGATHYHEQLGHPDKGRTINWLIVCYVVWLEGDRSYNMRKVRGLW